MTFVRRTFKQLASGCAVASILFGGSVLHGQAATPIDPTAGSTIHPAMWKLTGPHQTVYLFGSVHIMKKDVPWETPKIKAAFESSGTLYTEIGDLSDDTVKQLQPMILQLGMDQEHPLSTKISKEDLASLDAALKKMGAPGEATFEPMQPWLVYLTLSVLPAIQAGYDPSNGIDRVLQIKAKSENKPVMGFETSEQQMHFLADFPQADQVALLHEALVDLPKGVTQTNQMVEDWENGAVDKIAAMENDDLKLKHPDLYQRLLVSRNEKMSDRIATLLGGPDKATTFIAVGAAHLAGPDSIQTMLAKRGFVATREE